MNLYVEFVVSLWKKNLGEKMEKLLLTIYARVVEWNLATKIIV